jgi:SNARE associated Golgi protein
MLLFSGCLQVVLLLRLSPLLPLALSNYLYGLTSVDFVPYVLGSWLGMLPGTIAYVSAGGRHMFASKIVARHNTITSCAAVWLLPWSCTQDGLSLPSYAGCTGYWTSALVTCLVQHFLGPCHSD